MADDLGYGDTSTYGGWIDTPNLTRLAAQGMRLLDFHTSGNVCTPTRAGLLTGRYQQRAGLAAVIYAAERLPTHFDGLGSEQYTLAEALRDAGYATAIFGKWHLGYQAEHNPTQHGFDTFRGFISGNVDYQSHVDAQARSDWWQGAVLEPEEGYLTELVTDHAVRFIEEQKERPFFLYVPHHAPHYPFQGPRDPVLRTVGGTFEHVSSVPDRQRAYREMVEAMDRGLGAILDALEAQGLRDNTLVWFFSDNGARAEGSNAPLRGFKGSDWEGGHRVPSVVSFPTQVPPGTESSVLTSTLDVMATVLGLAGASADPELPLDGLDLRDVLRGGSGPAERQLFWGGDGYGWNGAAMREGRWKLFLDSPGRRSGPQNDPGPPQLYDLAVDLGEQTDLAAEHPVRVARMLEELYRWSEEVGSPNPTRPVQDAASP